MRSGGQAPAHRVRPSHHVDRYAQLARNFALTAEIDAVTAEVAGAFGREGVETLVLKGPVFARWLYPGEVRPYIDSDLMVAPRDWARAVGVLERLGFVEYLPWKPWPLHLDPGGTPFTRADGVVDLHCQLQGLGGDPDAIWGCLAASAERQVIGGVELAVPGRDAVLLHMALHAAHHASQADGKPLDDLRRALALVEESKWLGALDLARTCQGVPAFAAGLRLLPEGADLVGRLGLDEVQSLRHEIRREDNIFAEELYALISADEMIGRKLMVVASNVFPRPGYMRWWSPLARRGKLGLAGAYLWRAVWAMSHAPGALQALWRVQRANARGLRIWQRRQRR